MKKIILILLFFASSILSAETVYVISRKDYYDLEDIKNKLEAKEKSTFSNDIEVLISSVSCLKYSISAKTHRQFEIITDILEGLQKYDDKRYYSGANSRLDRELTNDEKISILGGRIDLLEKQLKGFMKIKLEGKK